MSTLFPADLRLCTDTMMINYLPVWCCDPIREIPFGV